MAQVQLQGPTLVPELCVTQICGLQRSFLSLTEGTESEESSSEWVLWMEDNNDHPKPAFVFPGYVPMSLRWEWLWTTAALMDLNVKKREPWQQQDVEVERQL